MVDRGQRTQRHRLGRGLNRDHERARFNMYFTANQPRPGCGRKPSKADIAALRCAYADIDAKDDRDMAAAFAAIGAVPLPPTCTIMTGGGFQPLWMLKDPVVVTPEVIRCAEALGGRIADLTGGDRVQNADRILRLPYTTNYPNARKRAAGRVPCPSGLVITGGGPRYTMDELEAALPPSVDAPKVAALGGAAVIPLFPGKAPAVSAVARPSTLNAAAKASLPERHGFGGLPTDQQNACVRASAAMPEIIATADREKPNGYLDMLFGFADAERLGATEAKEIARQWAQTSSRYDAADFERDWRSFDPNRPGGVTVGTLIGAAEKAGADPALWRAGATTTVVALSGHPTPMTAIPARMTPAEALALMNETVVFAHSWGGETLLAHILADGKVEAIDERQRKRSLANRQVIVQTKDKTVFVNLATWWLTHEGRREVDQVIFDPENVRSHPGEQTLNLWTGFARQPWPGRWRLMARHLFVIVCRRNRECWNT